MSKVKKNISVYLDTDDIRKLEEQAKELGMSVSSLCRSIIVRSLKGKSKASQVKEEFVECPNCGKKSGDKDSLGQQVFYKFPNGIWRCTNCGGEGRWKDV